MNIEILSKEDKFNLDDLIEFIKNSAVYDKNIDFIKNLYKTFKQLTKFSYKTPQIINKLQLRKEEVELKKEQNIFLEQPKTNIQISNNITNIENSTTKDKQTHSKIYSHLFNSSVNMSINHKIVSSIYPKSVEKTIIYFKKAFEITIYLTIYSVIFYFVYKTFYAIKDDEKANFRRKIDV